MRCSRSLAATRAPSIEPRNLLPRSLIASTIAMPYDDWYGSPQADSAYHLRPGSSSTLAGALNEEAARPHHSLYAYPEDESVPVAPLLRSEYPYEIQDTLLHSPSPYAEAMDFEYAQHQGDPNSDCKYDVSPANTLLTHPIAPQGTMILCSPSPCRHNHTNPCSTPHSARPRSKRSSGISTANSSQ